ncbi:hypothetical protein B0H34DRAFT_860160 [Crassisporium funariophilum]|nr:hypothetical protein B0H34DRAFT_860160 [Crassisporium funariophilum]
MLFKSMTVVCFLLMTIAVSSAPIDASSSDIYARANAVIVLPDSGGDYDRLLKARKLNPAELPEGCTRKEKKDHTKATQTQAKKCTKWDKLHAEFTGVVTVRVTAAIHAAESQLKLAGPLTVMVMSHLHHNLKHDDL